LPSPDVVRLAGDETLLDAIGTTMLATSIGLVLAVLAGIGLAP
jgi:ABC-type nitrate/sulfonate/bicarbonate transport system permease component